jgi:hypothetical protein
MVRDKAGKGKVQRYEIPSFAENDKLEAENDKLETEKDSIVARHPRV